MTTAGGGGGQGDMEKLEFLCTADGNVRQYWPPWEKSMVVPEKIRNRTTYNPAIPLTGVHTPRTENRNFKRYLHAHIHSSIIHNS